MTEDFIRDNNWNSSFPHHSIHMDTLREIADIFDLELSMPVNQVPIQYAGNSQNSNSVLDLMFLCANVEEFNNHSILTNL